MSEGRQAGFALCPLTTTDIDAYASRMGWEDFRTFFLVMRALDRTLLDWVTARQQREPETGKGRQNE